MYIVFEGIDGAGKSTQIQLLKGWFEENGLPVETIVEPTDSAIGRLIREYLTNEYASSKQDMLGLLFAADRLVLMDKIKNSDKIILSDRSFISSLAYQEPYDWIKIINKYALEPDLVILIDVDVEKSVNRCSGEDEFENVEFLKNVRENYLNIITDYNHIIINGNNGEDEVFNDIKKSLVTSLGLCSSCLD